MRKSGSNQGCNLSSIVALVCGWRGMLLVAGFGLTLLSVLPATAQAAGFTATTGLMDPIRQNHTSTTLNDGRVLITGGFFDTGTPFNSAVIYNPATDSFTSTGNMHFARRDHTATLLADGRVLIAGGSDGSSYLATAEIFNPAASGGVGAFTDTGSMPASRGEHTATLLTSGKVLITGGQDGINALNTAVIFDPAASGGVGAFASTGGMASARRLHTATRLNDGRVFLAGGSTTTSGSSDFITNTAEIFNPAGNGGVGTFTAVSSSMTSRRREHAATLLSDGRILITGGYYNFIYLASAEIFNSAGAGTFAATGSMGGGHADHTATRLPNGKVLIAGGLASFSAPYFSNAGEIFNPTGGSFSSAGTMVTRRAYHTAVTLNSGAILLVGGAGVDLNTHSAELYVPIKANPTAFAFQDTFETQTSQPQGFTLTNIGTSSLQLNSITVSNTDFSIVAGGTCAPPQSLAANNGSCTVNVTFNPATYGSKSANLVIATNQDVSSYSLPLRGTAIPLVPPVLTVTVNFAGTGGGSTTSTVTNLNCTSPSSCQAAVDYGTQITITPTANAESLFGSWASSPVAAGCSGSGDCVITVTSDTTATATFNFINPAKIVRTQVTYSTLLGAYNAAITGDVIQTREHTFAESPNFASGKTITINGGFDKTYSTNSGYYSSFSGGSFTIGTGQITLSNIVVR